MKVAIHQPHYFPWLGYLSKMASVDNFILMDEVQLTDSSNMYRNQLITLNGQIKYITIPFLKDNYKHISYNKLEINKSVNWQKNHSNFIRENYYKSSYFDEIWNLISYIFNKEFISLFDVAFETIIILKKIFNISTDIIFQSNLDYPKESKKNNLVLNLCIATKSDFYLSGKGGLKYMELDPFKDNHIEVCFQEFTMPAYNQFSSPNKFITGVSSLDMLFNCGIEKSRELFWENLK